MHTQWRLVTACATAQYDPYTACLVDSQESSVYSGGKGRLCSDCADAQAGMNLHVVHTARGNFTQVTAFFFFFFFPVAKRILQLFNGVTLSKRFYWVPHDILIQI